MSMLFVSVYVFLCHLFDSNFQGALNPDAEEAVTERFKISKARLRAELGDQLQSRFERLDETHESLEYIREKAELCANEAKVGCYQLFILYGIIHERLVVFFEPSQTAEGNSFMQTVVMIKLDRLSPLQSFKLSVPQ